MIEDVTPAEVRRWWNSRAETPSYRDSPFWLLHMIFEVALDDEVIHRNPVRVRDAGKKASKQRPTFTDNDVAKLLDAAEGDMKVMVTVLSWAGLRIGELLALDWADIEFLESRLEVTKHVTPQGIQPGTKTDADHTLGPLTSPRGSSWSRRACTPPRRARVRSSATRVAGGCPSTARSVASARSDPRQVWRTCTSMIFDTAR